MEKFYFFVCVPLSGARKIVARSLYRGREELLSTRASLGKKYMASHAFAAARWPESSSACPQDNIASDVNNPPSARSKINSTFDVVFFLKKFRQHFPLPPLSLFLRHI